MKRLTTNTGSSGVASRRIDHRLELAAKHVAVVLQGRWSRYVVNPKVESLYTRSVSVWAKERLDGQTLGRSGRLDQRRCLGNR